MSETALDLKHTLETQYGGTAKHVQSVPVYEDHKGKTLWNGAVQVFDIVDGKSKTTRVYAWSHGLPDGKRKFVSVAHTDVITCPKEAVRSVLQL